MAYNIANMYIANRDRAESGGGGGSNLDSRVSALELTVDGDSTASPPVVGLEDRVDDLEDFASNTAVASVTADGVKTYAALLDELSEAIPSGVHPARLSINGFNMSLGYVDGNTEHRYAGAFTSGSGTLYFRAARLKHGDTTHVYDQFQLGSGTATDSSATVPTEGEIIALYNF